MRLSVEEKRSRVTRLLQRFRETVVTLPRQLLYLPPPRKDTKEQILQREELHHAVQPIHLWMKGIG